MPRDTTANPWTREEILTMLWRKREQRALERAMAALLKRQTRDEQYAENTKYTNGVGFSAFHARTGTKLGKYAEGGGIFGPKWQSQAYRIAKVHVGQLVEIANSKR